MNKKQIDQELLTKLNDLQKSSTSIINQFGIIKAEKIRLRAEFEQLENTEDKLETEYIGIQKSFDEAYKEVVEKYGEGELDLETGSITV